MLEGPLRLAAVVLSLVVAVGWVTFAVDETRAAADQSAAEVAGRAASREADPTPAQEREREAAHGPLRELVDDANDVLLAPFAPIVDGSGSQWVRRSVPAVLALLLYGFGLATLANFARSGG
ncbi:hypothetical protein [Conexibacter sp. SYSU D00693]|uniref:hypothetical protein n=1 Tax=Conexibacter sp. SYSU D00693 TaxID=2812560 RepID=UPI00196A4C5E|nr:hypothetical protein [Conexibacter sp. SYSU D00693]